MTTVFSCVGSSRYRDPPWLENLGWKLAAMLPPFDATRCSGSALFVWAEFGCCCDAVAHGWLGPLRAKPLLSVFDVALAGCDAGCLVRDPRLLRGCGRGLPGEFGR